MYFDFLFPFLCCEMERKTKTKQKRHKKKQILPFCLAGLSLMNSRPRVGAMMAPTSAAAASLIYGPQAIFSPIHPFPPAQSVSVGFNNAANHLGRASSHPINIQSISPNQPLQAASSATMAGLIPAGSPIRSPPLRFNSKDSRSSSP